jgi:hypothetical protein
MTAWVVLLGAVVSFIGWSGLPPKFFNWAIAYGSTGPQLARDVTMYGGIAIMAIAILVFLRSCSAGWHRMWSIRLHDCYKYPVLVRNDGLPFRWFIPVSEAAAIARERTADLPIARVANEVCGDGKVTLLSYYAGLLCDADWITLYGCPRNSRRLERISPDVVKRAHFVDDGAALAKRTEIEPAYTSIHMCRLEMSRRVKQLVAAQRPATR